MDSKSMSALFPRGGKVMEPEDEQAIKDREDVQKEQTDEAAEKENSDAPAEDRDLSAAAVLEVESAKEERAEYVHPEGARDYRVEGNDVRDYVGVDPEYMTYANATEAPILTDTERWDHTSQYDHLEGNYDDEGDPEEVQDEEVLDRDFTDEDGDGKDDVTGLTRDEFYQARRSAQEYRDNPNPESEVEDPKDRVDQGSEKAPEETQNTGFNPLV